MGNDAVLLDFIGLVADFMNADATDASESRFERAASPHWMRVHDCLFFPRAASPAAAFYGETEPLFNHGSGGTAVFNKRTPATGFRLLANRDIRRSRQDCAGIYSYGPYLGPGNEIRDGLLLAHLFMPAGRPAQEAIATLRHGLSSDRFRYDMTAPDALTLNLFCLRHVDDAAAKTHP